MGCKNCKNGCGDGSIASPTSFSNDPTICPPGSESCTELFDMSCVCYQGEDIVEFDIQRGDRLDEVLQKLVLGIRNAGCAVFEDETTCSAPINLTIDELTTSTFGISWDTVPDATTYRVEFKEATSGVWLASPDVTAPNVSDTIVGLLADTVYDVRVVSTCNTGGPCYSLNIRIKTLVA